VKSGTVFYIPNGDFGDSDLGRWMVGQNPLPVQVVGQRLRLGSDAYACDQVPLGVARAAIEMFVPADTDYSLHVDATVYTYDQLPDPNDADYDAFEVHIDGNVTRFGNPNPPINCSTQREIDVSRAWSLRNYQGDVMVNLENHSRFDNLYNTYTDVNRIWIGE
jgi:hypothetical protein